jgi:peroxiredoxin
MKTNLRLLIVATLAVALLTVDGVQAETPSRVGRKIEAFSLRDGYGHPHQLDDFKSHQAVVVVFLGTECPLAKLYAHRLAELHERFHDRGVAIVGIDANTQDAPTEIVQFTQKNELPFPVLKDPGQKVADQFAAQRTPEAFVLDHERVIRYAGRIDDQYGIGYQRPQPETQFVAAALDDLLAGRPVAQPETEGIGCLIGRDTPAQSTGEITYASHIAEILNRRCVECHREQQIAPFPLASYDDLQGWGDMVLEVIDNGRMPPWYADPAHGEFRNDARLTAEEKRLLRVWIENGMPAGNLAQAPPAPEFATGWRIPAPDQVFYMSDKPFEVPAEGVVDYQYFEVDPGFTEDKYIWAAEARPENPAVVHHIIVFIKVPGQEDPRAGGMVDAYAPGSQPRILNNGLAIRVPAGSKLLFEMHYTPNGSPQKDRSHIGIKFLDKQNVRKLVYGNLALNEEFVIPANASHHEVTATRHIDVDMMLLNLSPHMHLRGKAFRYEAQYPDGTRETLLDVPHYDFNWQLTYELVEPKLLPKGTQIHCTAAFDNSAGNPANPDPNKEVRWGEQSWEEMMIGFFDVIPVGQTR